MCNAGAGQVNSANMLAGAARRPWTWGSPELRSATRAGLPCHPPGKGIPAKGSFSMSKQATRGGRLIRGLTRGFIDVASPRSPLYLGIFEVAQPERSTGFTISPGKPGRVAGLGREASE